MQLLIILAAVLTSSLVAATGEEHLHWQEWIQLHFNMFINFSPTDESGQCVSRQEFDSLKEQLARSRQETAAVKGEVDSWQNSTLLILKQENLSELKLKYISRWHSLPAWMTWLYISITCKYIHHEWHSTYIQLETHTMAWQETAKTM